MLCPSLLFGLFVVFATAVEGGTLKQPCKKTCGAIGRTLSRYAGNTDDTVQITFPCKYHAVRHRCGDYYIQITPGMKAMVDDKRPTAPWYLTEKLHVVIKRGSMDGERLLDARITEKSANAYLESVKKGLPTGHVFANSASDGEDQNEKVAKIEAFGLVYGEYMNKRVTVRDEAGDFEIQFQPHRGGKASQKSSKWKFTCFEVNHFVEPTESEVCDDNDAFGITARSKNNTFRGSGKSRKIKQFFYDVLTHQKLFQTDETCIAAEDILQRCPNAQDAIGSCWRILGQVGKTRCILKNKRNVMSVFNDCLKFVCNGRDVRSNECRRIEESSAQCDQADEKLSCEHLTEKRDDDLKEPEIDQKCMKKAKTKNQKRKCRRGGDDTFDDEVEYEVTVTEIRTRKNGKKVVSQKKNLVLNKGANKKQVEKVEQALN